MIGLYCIVLSVFFTLVKHSSLAMARFGLKNNLNSLVFPGTGTPFHARFSGKPTFLCTIVNEDPLFCAPPKYTLARRKLRNSGLKSFIVFPLCLLRANPSVPYSGCTSAMYITGKYFASFSAGVDIPPISSMSKPYSLAILGCSKKALGLAMIY